LGSGSIGRLELGYLEEERVRVLAKVDELKGRITELEQQLQESKQEVNRSHKLLYCWLNTLKNIQEVLIIVEQEVMRGGTENVRWISRVC